MLDGMSAEALMTLSWVIVGALGALIPLFWLLMRKFARSHHGSN